MVMEIIGVLPRIINFILTIALLFVAMFFGKIALAGWGKKFDFFSKIILTIILGFLCFTVGILLPFDFFPQIAFISHTINTFIVAIFLYAILFFLSEERKKPQFLTKGDISSIEQAIEFLKSEVTRINQALVKKGIQPKPISEKDVKKITADILDSKNIKEYVISSVEQKENVWNVLLKIKGKKHKLVIDLYGQLKEFKMIGFNTSKIMTRLKEDKMFLIGSVLALIFLVLVVSLLTPQNIQRVSETFSLYGVELIAADCVTPAVLLERWNDEEGRVYDYNYDFSRAENSIKNYLDDEYFVNEFILNYQIIVEDENIYGAFIASEDEIKSMVDFASAIRGKSQICSVDLDSYDVCACNSVTDTRTATQILGLLEEIAN